MDGDDDVFIFRVYHVWE